MGGDEFRRANQSQAVESAIARSIGNAHPQVLPAATYASVPRWQAEGDTFAVPAVALRWAARGRLATRCGGRVPFEHPGQVMPLAEVPAQAVLINGRQYIAAFTRRRA